MAGLDQQEYKNPFDYIENIKALDPSKVYFINMSFEDNPGFEYRCKMAEALQNAFNSVAQKIYSQNPGAGAGFDPNQAGGPNGGADNVYDADYTVVDDDK